MADSKAPLTGGEKIQAGLLSLGVFGCCGPITWFFFTNVLFWPGMFLVSLLWEPLPDWVITTLVIGSLLGGFLVALGLVVSGAIKNTIRQRENAIIRKAQLRRAERELAEDEDVQP